MYKEVVINGDIYPEVQKVELPINQGGGTKASFVETSDSDAVSTDIASGKTAYVNGTKITGAMPKSSITNSGLLISATPGNVSNANQNEISWNGIRGGLTCVMTSSYLGFYKISNNYVSTNQSSLLIGGTAYLGTTPYPIESSNVTVGTGYIRVAHSSMWGDTAIIVSTPGAVYSGQTFAETGTYLRHDGSLYISKLILNGGANIFVNNEISLADANLLAANIKSGVNILGIIGTYTGSSSGAVVKTGSYTPSSNVTNYTVSHGCGKTPTYIAIYPVFTKLSSSTYLGGVATSTRQFLIYQGTSSSSGRAYAKSTSNSSWPTSGSNNNLVYNVGATNFTMGCNSTAAYLRSGYTYNWIAIAT